MAFNSTYGAIGSGIGSGLGGGLAALFGGGKWSNPADAAMPYTDEALNYLSEIPDELKPLFEPYMNAGGKALPQYLDLSSSLATPQGAIDNYNALGAGFTSSPGYAFQKDQMTQGMNAAAAASGMAGTPAAQLALMGNINDLASQDYNNYMRTVSGYQTQGLGGLRDVSHLGFDANSAYGQALMEMLLKQAGISMDRSGLAYAGQANKNKMNAQKADMWGTIGSGIGGTAGTLAGFL